MRDDYLSSLRVDSVFRENMINERWVLVSATYDNSIQLERLGWLRQELTRAYEAAKLGKTKRQDVIKFNEHLCRNLDQLTSDIHFRKYNPRPSTAFIIHDPVHREVFAANFRDRIVHHFLFNQVNPWWNTRFIEDSYSCRVGKGTLYGIKRLDHHMRSESRDYTRPAYVLKLDIEGYFMSLSRKKLFDRVMWGLKRQFPEGGYQYQICRYLWKVVIFNDPVKDVILNSPRDAWRGLPPSKSLFNQKKGYGIAIGNLTSQLLSNIYLDQLDRFVTIKLGFKHYGRYVDDFFVVSSDKRKLIDLIDVVETYLSRELQLRLHPRKRYLQESKRGVAFIGAVVYPFRIQPGKRLKRNFLNALTNSNYSKETYFSYVGLVKHYKCHKLLGRIAPASW